MRASTPLPGRASSCQLRERKGERYAATGRRASSGRGFSLIEVVFALAIFAVLVVVLAFLETQYVRFDRSARIDYFTHPEKRAVVARLRRDVLDSHSYPSAFAGHTQSETTLIVRGASPGVPTTIVWTFDQESARRQLFEGAAEVSSWTAHGVPSYTISSYEMPDGSTAVRIQAHDAAGRVVIDRIFDRRAGS